MLILCPLKNCICCVSVTVSRYRTGSSMAISCCDNELLIDRITAKVLPVNYAMLLEHTLFQIKCCRLLTSLFIIHTHSLFHI